MRTQDGQRVLIVPILLVFDDFEKFLRKLVNGPEFTMAKQRLVPDNRIVDWVFKSTRAAAQ